LLGDRRYVERALRGALDDRCHVAIDSAKSRAASSTARNARRAQAQDLGAGVSGNSRCSQSRAAWSRARDDELLATAHDGPGSGAPCVTSTSSVFRLAPPESSAMRSPRSCSAFGGFTIATL